MENLRREVTLLDIHVLKAVLALFSQKLVVQGLFEIDSFQVEQGNYAIVVSSVTDVVVCISALSVNIDFLMDHILRRSKLSQ
jgi:hypothetical protein